MRTALSNQGRLLPVAAFALVVTVLASLPAASPAGAAGPARGPGGAVVRATESPTPSASTSPGPTGSPAPTTSPTPSSSPSPSTSPAPTRQPIVIAAAIAAGVVTSNRGFRTGTIVLSRGSSGSATATLRFRTGDDDLRGQLAQVWVRTADRAWRMLAVRRFASIDGGAEIRLVRSVREMTGFRLRYLGDADHRGAWSPAVWVRVR